MKVEKVKKQEPVEKDPIAAIVSASKTENTWPIEDLPSKYRLYPEGTQLFGRPLKVMEIKMLSSLSESNLNYVINDVLRRCITGYPIEELTVPDKLYLIFWLRANTYKDSGYKIEYECPECKTQETFEVELNSLNIKYIKDSFDENKELVLPSENIIKIKSLRIADEIRVANFEKMNAKSMQSFDSDLLYVASLISEINGKKVGLIEAYEFVASGNSDPRDYAYIISYINFHDFGVDPEVKVPCQKCGGTATVAVTFRPDFFVPKYTFE